MEDMTNYIFEKLEKLISEEDFSEFQDIFNQAIEMKDRHLNEIIERMQVTQKNAEIKLEEVKKDGNTDKILYAQGLLDGVNWIVEPTVKNFK